jgi:O-antigen/teichoic acid export membrane protein
VRSKSIIIFAQITRLLSLFRLRTLDTSTEGGRSRERFRRAAMTTVSAGGAKVIGLLASLITVPLTFSYLGQERYGLWMVLISIIGVMGFADLGIGNGLMNAISEAYGKDDRHLAREYVTSAFVMMLCIAAFFAVSGAAAYPFIPWVRLFNVKSGAVAVEGARAFLVLYSWFVISIPLGVVTRAQAGLQQGYMPQIVGALGSVLTLLALLAAIKLHGSLAWLVFASTMGSVAATVFNGWFLFHEHPWLLPARHAYRANSANKILRLGLLFFALQCAVALGYTSDNIVITQVLGAAAVAAYAVPQKLFGFVYMVVGMATGPLWPAYGEALARGDVAWVRRVFWGSLWLTLAITVPLCLLLALAGPWILSVFFGKSLHAPMSLLVVLALWGVVGPVSTTVSMLLNGAGVLKPQALLVMIVCPVNLGLSVLLTIRYGVIGVCLGSIAAQTLITLPAYAWLISRVFRQPLDNRLAMEESSK